MKTIKISVINRLIYPALLPLLALILQWVLWKYLQSSIWFFFFPAVFFSAWIDGLRGAVISLLISMLLAMFFFIEPQLSFKLDFSKNVISTVVFIFLGLLFGFAQTHWALLAKRKHIEEALRKSEERYRKIVETSLEGISITSPEGDIIFTNKRFTEMLGISLNEIIGRPETQFITEEQRVRLQEVRNNLKRGNNVQEVMKFVRKDGAVIWTLFNASPIYDGEGNHMGNLAMHTDITHRQKLEDELALRERLDDLMISHLPNSALYILDSNMKFIKSGGHLLKRIGFNDEMLKGKTVREILPPEIFSVMELSFHKALNGEEASCETFFRDMYWLNIFVPVFDQEKKVDNVLFLTTDITSHKNIENELRLAQDKLNIALENANLGIWEWNLDTDKVIWDERSGKMFGFECGISEEPYTSLGKYIQEEDLPHVKQAINQIIKSGDRNETVFRTKPVNGDVRYIYAKAFLNKSREGNPQKIIGTFFDVTSIKKGTEQVLLKMNQELIRSNKDLQQFAYVASHDLQEPLRMVSSFTQLLELRYHDKLDKDGREYIKFAVEGANRMYSLLNGLLAYSRVQARGKEFHKVKMNDILEKVLNNLSLKITEKQAKIEIKKLPVIYADENQMIQMVQNLIDNSLKFNRDIPNIIISCRSSNEYHTFSIKDDGIGIEPQYFEKIFMIFQRLHQNESFDGTGIGLAICKRIVERHGGKIWVESDPGKGSEFLFTIPKYKFISLH